MRIGILLCLATAAAAEDPARLLESEAARDRAWGCWLAGEQNAEALVPALRRRIGDESFHVRQLALDALIRIGSPVPWQELQPVWDSERVACLILLARDPEPGILLELLDEVTDVAQKTALCNLLSGLRAPGFAVRMLAETEVTVDVHVSDPGVCALHGCGGAGRGGRGGVRVRGVPGWPPRVGYALVDGQSAGARVFSDGPFPVSYLRQVVEQSGTMTTRRGFGSFRDRPYAYLAAMAQRDELPLARSYAPSLEWRGPETFRQDVAAALAGVAADHARLVALLRDQGLLTGEEANGLEPRIAVRVTDLRADQTTPLPAIDA